MLGFSSAVAVRGTPSPWDPLIAQLAGGDPFLIAMTKAVIAHESEWNPNAANPADPSYGLMQILYGPKGPYPSYTIQQLLDPVTNIEAGTAFLFSKLSQHGGDPAAALSAYNGGHPLVLADGSYANQDYIDDALAYYDWYVANDPMLAGAGLEPAPATPAAGDASAEDTSAGIGAGAFGVIGLVLAAVAVLAATRGGR